MLDVIGEVVVLVQSDSGSDTHTDLGSDTHTATEPDTDTEAAPVTPLETGTEVSTEVSAEVSTEVSSGPLPMLHGAFDPVTFPADRISEWLRNIPEDRELETGSQESAGADQVSAAANPESVDVYDPLVETQAVGGAIADPESVDVYDPLVETQAVGGAIADPETTAVLETCAQLLTKLEEVRLAVLHLQYSLHVGTSERARQVLPMGSPLSRETAGLKVH